MLVWNVKGGISWSRKYAYGLLRCAVINGSLLLLVWYLPMLMSLFEMFRVTLLRAESLI